MAKGKYRTKKAAHERAQASSDSCAPEAEQKAVAPVMEFDRENAGLTALDFEYQAALNAAGKEEKVYGVWGPIWRFLEWYHAKKGKHTFKKKTYLLLMLFFGWMGGHRYYQGRRILALFYTLFFWTGIPLILCVTDFMEVVPLKADENGFVTL